MVDRKIAIAILLSLGGMLISCEHGDSPRTRELPEYIGHATMDAQGVLTLVLIGFADDGSVGHARVVIPPDDPRYGPYLQHIGPMRPGEGRPIRPWPRPEPPAR